MFRKRLPSECDLETELTTLYKALNGQMSSMRELIDQKNLVGQIIRNRLHEGQSVLMDRWMYQSILKQIAQYSEQMVKDIDWWFQPLPADDFSRFPTLPEPEQQEWSNPRTRPSKSGNRMDVETSGNKEAENPEAEDSDSEEEVFQVIAKPHICGYFTVKTAKTESEVAVASKQSKAQVGGIRKQQVESYCYECYAPEDEDRAKFTHGLAVLGCSNLGCSRGIHIDCHPDTENLPISLELRKKKRWRSAEKKRVNELIRIYRAKKLKGQKTSA